jgi:hypothetical protein
MIVLQIAAGVFATYLVLQIACSVFLGIHKARQEEADFRERRAALIRNANLKEKARQAEADFRERQAALIRNVNLKEKGDGKC